MLILPLSIVLSFLAPLPQRSSGRDIAVTSFTAHPSAARAPLASADLDGVAEQCAAHVEEPLPRAISAAGSTAIQAANEGRRHLKIVQRVVIHERRRTCDPQLSADGNETDPDPFNKLLLSLLIDAIGMATYLLPVAGETGDLAWAPISAYLIYQLYGNGLISGLAFAEELLQAWTSSRRPRSPGCWRTLSLVGASLARPLPKPGAAVDAALNPVGKHAAPARYREEHDKRE